MKSLKIAALLLSFSALLFAQEVTVKGNSKLNTDFSKYKTFSWSKTDKTALRGGYYEIYTYSEKVYIKNAKVNKNKKSAGKAAKTDQPVVYYYSHDIIPAANASVNSAIRASITQELEGRGYRKNEGYGDLIVAYKVLDRKSKIKGYINDEPEVVGGTEVRQAKDTITYYLEPGSLMINLIDKKTSEVVWYGFASGLTQGKSFATDPIKVKEAIHLIFEEFKYRADKVAGDNADNNK